MAKKAMSQMKSGFETYIAKASAKMALALAQEQSPFTIEVRFLGGLSTKQKNAFKLAADRWTKMIIGDLPSVQVDGEVIDDVLILAQGVAIDGPGKILGQAGPTALRPAGSAKTALLPAKGIMSFDTADLSKMESNGTLNDVITHEMGHVLGIGTLWKMKKLLKNVETENPVFRGAASMVEYAKLKGQKKALAVPVENTGGGGTRDSHWREMVFRNELMSGFIAGAGNPLSRLTVASLQDIGYTVNMKAAEAYTLPNLLALAEAGLLVSHEAPIDGGMVLPSIPVVLPKGSLV